MKALVFLGIGGLVTAFACGAGSANSLSSTGTGTGTGAGSSVSANAYDTAYHSVAWGSTMTVSFPSTCELKVVTTGLPNYSPNAYYLAPVGGNMPVVAYTAVTHTALGVVSYANTIEPSLQGSSMTLNDCPTMAASPTATGPGAIGFLISGTAMFNPYEADQSTPAVADNASYSFTDANGTAQTAYFIDTCNSHSNGMTWHAHGVPNCVTAQVDSATGPSHIIGIALDGFPIYGGRDINGNVITTLQLDACNGITSPTPEFPNGAYHYVLPLNVTTSAASINCLSGTLSAANLARARALACNMKAMFARALGHAAP